MKLRVKQTSFPLKYLLLVFLFSSCNLPLLISQKNIQLYHIIENGKLGYIDQTGKVRIPAVYTPCISSENRLENFSDLYEDAEGVVLKRGGKFGVVNWQNKEVVPFIYDSLYSQKKTIYTALLDGKYGMLDKRGKVLVPFLFERPYFLNEAQIFPVEMEGKWSLYNPKLRTFQVTDYQKVRPFIHNLGVVETKNEKQGAIDQTGQLIIDTIYQSMNNYWVGPIPVQSNSKWKYLDRKGQTKIEGPFDEAETFSMGFAVVVQKEQYGVIDVQGNIVIPFKYSYLQNCYDGHFHFADHNPYSEDGTPIGLINAKGDTLLKNEFEDIFEDEGFAVVVKNGKTGVIRVADEKLIIPYAFNEIDYDIKGISTYYFEDANGQQYFGYVNRKEKIIWSNNEQLLLAKLNQR